MGLEKPDTGQVRLLGQEAGLERLIAQKVAYIPQSSQVNWQFPATVFEIVLMGRFAHSKGMFRRPTKADRQIVEQALERLKLRIYAIVRLISFQVGSVSGYFSESPGTGSRIVSYG